MRDMLEEVEAAAERQEERMEAERKERRAQYAAMAMQGILSSNPPDDVEDHNMSKYMEYVAEYSVMAADALLRELEK